MGRFGEDTAADFLEGRGLTILSRNANVRGGEIDIIARDGRRRVVVEVRTRLNGDDPIDAIDDHKRDRVARLAARYGVDRVDLVGIGVTDGHVDIHWLPDAL